MKREIKFRAWNKRLKKMFAVYAIDWKNGLVYCEGDDGNPHTFGLADVELMQNTCLPDKNGKEIYEGDILECFTSGTSVIEFNGGLFGLKNKVEGFVPFNYLYGDVEVLGNIYEHPHLLEEARR